MDSNDRLPPQDLTAEQAVLGCCLLEKAAMDQVAGHVTISDFYREAHRVIYEVIQELYDDDEPVDIVTVSSGLRRIGKLDEAGGGEYLTALIGEVPTAKHVARYVKTMKNCAALREGILVGSDLQGLCYSFPEDPSKAVADAIQRLEALQAMCHPNGVPRSLAETAVEDEAWINKRRARPYDVGTARLGIPEFDQITGGMEDFGYACVKATTGHGKTAFAIQCAVSTGWAISVERDTAIAAERDAAMARSKTAQASAAKKVAESHKKVIIWFGLEESRWQIRLRMAGFCGEFDTRDCRTAEAWGRRLLRDRTGNLEMKYLAALEEVRGLPIIISDEPQTIHGIEAHCRRIAKESTPVMIVIDYLQLVGKDGKSEREEQEFRDMANRLRRLSDKLKCPILGLSQVTVSGSGKSRTVMAAQAKALQNSADTDIMIERDVEEGTRKKLPFLTLYSEKAKGSPEFPPFKVYEDPQGRRWGAANDKQPDPSPQGDRKQRDRSGN